MNLVAGLLGREAAACVFGGGAVIDDTVDFSSNRHRNAVRIGEFHHDADLRALDVAILADSADAGFPRKRQLLLTPSRHTGENRTEGGQTATVENR